MTPVGISSAPLNTPQQVKPQTQNEKADAVSSSLKVEKNSVTLSDEGKALLAALQEIEKESAKPAAEKTVGEKVESFTHGALGIDRPEKIEEEQDDSYSAGQYLSAAATVGGIILALV